MPIWAPKPYLSHAGYRKNRAGRMTGGEMGGKKGRSSKRGGTGASSVVTASA